MHVIARLVGPAVGCAGDQLPELGMLVAPNDAPRCDDRDLLVL
jgi:hypothetical protein